MCSSCCQEWKMDLKCLIKETWIKTKLKTNSKMMLIISAKDSRRSKKVGKMLQKTPLKNLSNKRRKWLNRLLNWKRNKPLISNRSKPIRKRKDKPSGLWSGTFSMLLWHMLCVISSFRSLDNYQSSRFMELSKALDSERYGVMTKTGKLILKFIITTKWFTIIHLIKKLV